MIRKSAVAVTAAAALALGTASATSLGSFDDLAFAASDIELLNCQLASDAISLVPDLPSPGDLSTDTLVDTATALLGSIELDLDPTNIAAACVDAELFDIIILDTSGNVIDVIEGDPDDAVGNVLSLDVSSLFTATVPDVTTVGEIRLILSEA